jgi:ABC-type xylose transport system substrate-binding protein
VLIVPCWDKDAVLPAVRRAQQRKIPVIAYDRLVEAPDVFYITFDNKEVGRLQAQAILDVGPKGRYVMIKGSPTDPNADFVHAGQQEVLAPAIQRGDAQIVGEEYTDGGRPAVAQKTWSRSSPRPAARWTPWPLRPTASPVARRRRWRRAACAASRCRARMASRPR